jgi:Tfp pilus assembly protein FimT
MLVVLALIGLLAGVALPNLSRMLEAYSASIQWAELTAEIDALPFRAYSQSRAMQLNEATAGQLLAALPAGWKVKINGAIRYRDNGWCDGGRILIIADSGEQRQFELTAPQCRTAGP